MPLGESSISFGMPCTDWTKQQISSWFSISCPWCTLILIHPWPSRDLSPPLQSPFWLLLGWLTPILSRERAEQKNETQTFPQDGAPMSGSLKAWLVLLTHPYQGQKLRPFNHWPSSHVVIRPCLYSVTFQSFPNSSSSLLRKTENWTH